MKTGIGHRGTERTERPSQHSGITGWRAPLTVYQETRLCQVQSSDLLHFFLGHRPRQEDGTTDEHGWTRIGGAEEEEETG